MSIDNDPADTNVFFSASDDGTVRQFDLRLASPCRAGQCTCVNVLLHRKGCEGNSVAVHPLFPHYIAFACSDVNVLVYDRRRLSLDSRQPKWYPAEEDYRTSLCIACCF